VGVLGLSQVLFDSSNSGAMSLILLAAANLLAGILLLPSVYYALGRLAGWKTFNFLVALRVIRPSLLIFIFPMVVLLGTLIVRYTRLAWLFLPGLHILAVGLPVLWLLFVAVRNLPLGPPQRIWGIFGSGLVLGPGLILVFELGALLVFAFIGGVVIANQPQLLAKIRSLSIRMPAVYPTQQELLDLFTPYLFRPGVILAALAFAAGVVPLIEEIFKPIGVWLLWGRSLTPAMGFAAGALSGAGYALFESLVMFGGNEAWPEVVIARIGTAVLHIATSSLTGWALVQAWNQARYLRLGLAYLGAVFLHGLWNGLTVFAAFGALSGQVPGADFNPTLARISSSAVPVVLILLAATIFTALIWVNRALVKSLPAIETSQVDETNQTNEGHSEFIERTNLETIAAPAERSESNLRSKQG
jgi:hypothetical protein